MLLAKYTKSFKAHYLFTFCSLLVRLDAFQFALYFNLPLEPNHHELITVSSVSISSCAFG